MAKPVSSVSCIINDTVVRGSRDITRVILFLTNPSGVESYLGGISMGTPPAQGNQSSGAV